MSCIPGTKYDGMKPRYDLIPAESEEDVAKVLAAGAEKYAVDNWKWVPKGKRRYWAAALRHIWARIWGKILDDETGLPHLAHAICCLHFANWFDKFGHVVGKRVYISGPITGMPDLNRPAFEEMKKRLTEAGYLAISPFDVSMVSDKKNWQDYMRADIEAMMGCDAVLMLPGWEKSTGACIEFDLVQKLGIPAVMGIADLKQELDSLKKK